jgi:predicted nuclease with TOPRIM domain
MRSIDKQQIVLVSGVLLLTAVFGVFRYKPLMQQRVALDETIAQNQSTLQEIQTKEMKLPELAEQIKRMQTQTAVFDAKIPAAEVLQTYGGRSPT